jgi:hypothetical protein
MVFKCEINYHKNEKSKSFLFGEGYLLHYGNRLEQYRDRFKHFWDAIVCKDAIINLLLTGAPSGTFDFLFDHICF